MSEMKLPRGKYWYCLSVGNKFMETTFDKFINSNPKRKEKFDKEYNEFLLSEFALEKMEFVTQW